MNLSKYQKLAARTIACTDPLDMARHAGFGLIAEIDEFEESFRKTLRGFIHEYDCDDNLHDIHNTLDEAGDIWWMVAELATANGVELTIKKSNPWEQSSYIHEREKHVELLKKEAAKLAGMLQKTYQGHGFIGEAETASLICSIIARLFIITDGLFGYELCWILKQNIWKLEERYPDGFDSERSLNRKPGDV